jgi:molybdate transport system substrate-binding protein
MVNGWSGTTELRRPADPSVRRLRRGSRLLLGLVALLTCFASHAETLRIAVASNFTATARVLAERFAARTGIEPVLAVGATGKHYAQIVHGAPFDLFLAADSERPARLDAEGRVVDGVRFTYAIGELVLWLPGEDRAPLPERLGNADLGRIAIANPRLAPYGRAAREALQSLGLWDHVQGRLVRGENIAQTFQFVDTRHAAAGLVARSQLATLEEPITGTVWPVPATLHQPIEQQAALLRDSPAARAFADFLGSEEARQLIRQRGYRVP